MSKLSFAPAARPRARRWRWVPETGLQAAIWALVMVCVLAPVIPLIYASVQDKPIYASDRTFTLAAYGQLLSDAAFRTAALNTLEFACLTTVSAVVLSAGFAVLCGRTDVLGRRVYARLFVIPILLPGLGVILGWNALYGEGGYAHDVLTQTLHIPFDLTTVPGMAVLGTATAVPVVFLICQAGLSGIDSSLENAARGVGASPLRVLTRVTMPLLRPALLSSGLLVFTLAVEALGIPLVFGSPQGHDFAASYLYNTWSNALTPDPPIVSAGATVLLVVACGLLLLRRTLLGGQARFVSIGGRAAAAGGLRLGRWWRVLLGIVMGLYLLATTFAPLVALALSSVVSVLTPLIAPWDLLTAANWSAIQQDPYAAALDAGAQVVLAGRATDTSLVVVVAVALPSGTAPGPAWHAAKTVECGGQCTTNPQAGGVFVRIDKDGFTVTPLSPDAACIPQSVAAHMLYENADPFHLVEPSGTLDTTAATYTAIDDRVVRVEGGHRRGASDGLGRPSLVSHAPARPGGGHGRRHPRVPRRHALRGHQRDPLASRRAPVRATAPRVPKQKGRSRIVGTRLPTLAARLGDPTTIWTPLTVPFWDGETNRTIEIVSDTALWDRTGHPPVPVRGVLIRDPDDAFPSPALLCRTSTPPRPRSCPGSSRGGNGR